MKDTAVAPRNSLIGTHLCGVQVFHHYDGDEAAVRFLTRQPLRVHSSDVVLSQLVLTLSQQREGALSIYCSFGTA